MFGRYDNRFGTMEYKIGMSILRLLPYFDNYLTLNRQQTIRDILNKKHRMTTGDDGWRILESASIEGNENIGGKRNKNKTKRYNNARRRISRKMQSHRRLSRRI